MSRNQVFLFSMLDILQENENSWSWWFQGKNRLNSGLFGVYSTFGPGFEFLNTRSTHLSDVQLFLLTQMLSAT
jgi:hypothetical protein